MSSFAGLPPFVFGTRAWVDQLVCPLRTFVRANDGTRDLYAPMLAWSAGPPAIGDTGDNSPAHMLGTTWLLQVCPSGDWVLYREVGGQLEVMTFDDPPDAVGVTARHVSLAFDQAARVVLAWEEGGVIKVRRWDPTANEYIENVSFVGHDPCVVIDASWSLEIPGSDVLLFYLSADRTKVLCRVQRDIYAVEHLIWDYGQPVILDRAVAAPLRYQLLVSDATGAPLPQMLLSALYPFLAYDTLAATATGPTAGAYQQVVIPHELAEALSVAAAGPTSGTYADPLITYLLAGDGISASATGPTGGAYADPIINHLLGEGLDADAAGPTAGEYKLVILETSLTGEGVKATATGPTGGTYA